MSLWSDFFPCLRSSKLQTLAEERQNSPRRHHPPSLHTHPDMASIHSSCSLMYLLLEHLRIYLLAWVVSQRRGSLEWWAAFLLQIPYVSKATASASQSQMQTDSHLCQVSFVRQSIGPSADLLCLKILPPQPQLHLQIATPHWLSFCYPEKQHAASACLQTNDKSHSRLRLCTQERLLNFKSTHSLVRCEVSSEAHYEHHVAEIWQPVVCASARGVSSKCVYSQKEQIMQLILSPFIQTSLGVIWKRPGLSISKSHRVRRSGDPVLCEKTLNIIFGCKLQSVKPKSL